MVMIINAERTQSYSLYTIKSSQRELENQIVPQSKMKIHLSSSSLHHPNTSLSKVLLLRYTTPSLLSLFSLQRLSPKNNCNSLNKTIASFILQGDKNAGVCSSVAKTSYFW